MRFPFILASALLFCVSCGDGDEPANDAPRNAATATTGQPDAEPEGLDAALRSARSVELPDAPVEIDFREPHAAFRASNASSYVETAEATVTDSAGERIYWLDLTIAHAAEPLSFHARGTIGGTAETWKYMGVSWGLHDRFEVIRVKEQYWTRSPDEWSGPKAGDYVVWLSKEGPSRGLSSRFANIAWADSVGGEIIEGRRATHFLVTDRSRLDGVWNGATTELPNEPLPFDAEGTADLWILESGLVVRARLEARNTDGRTFRATLDLHDFGGPVNITAPDVSSHPVRERLP